MGTIGRITIEHLHTKIESLGDENVTLMMMDTFHWHIECYFNKNITLKFICKFHDFNPKYTLLIEDFNGDSYKYISLSHLENDIEGLNKIFARLGKKLNSSDPQNGFAKAIKEYFN